MNGDLTKDQEHRMWALNRARRSRSFLFYITLMVLGGIGAIAYSFFFDSDPLVIKSFIFIDVFSVVLLITYWYLQLRPIYLPSELYRERKQRYLIRDHIGAINEIEEALSIYDEGKSEESELAIYIANRMDALPIGDEFHDRNDRWVAFDKNILTDQTRLRLYKATLNSLKTRLLNERDTEDEKAKALGAEESEKEKSIERINDLINLATTRLKKEIELLSKRANIYIAFGSAITVAAGAVLYFAVQDILGLYPINGHDSQSIITALDVFSVVIRLSIVIFIEVFAFYYLRLYRNIIEDIKFYQNEITNIESKLLSLYVADSDDSKKLLVTELAKTERNFIISNKQTTVDLERRKNDFDLLKSSTDSIVKIIKSAKS